MSGISRPYVVVIGDLIDSKKIANRYRLQEALGNRLDELSTHPSIVSPYTITLGDEFQAVFASGQGLFQSLFAIRAQLHPVSCRFAISIGQLNTAINPQQAIGMDGPAFHGARDAINDLKKRQLQLKMTGLSRSMSALIDPVAQLLWASTGNWKKSRLEILTGLIEGQTERELANRLDLSERAIYKNSKDGHLRQWIQLIQEVEGRITKILQP